MANIEKVHRQHHIRQLLSSTPVPITHHIPCVNLFIIFSGGLGGSGYCKLPSANHQDETLPSVSQVLDY
jgi:hypothetical protein